jgi:hypothetical protein
MSVLKPVITITAMGKLWSRRFIAIIKSGGLVKAIHDVNLKRDTFPQNRSPRNLALRWWLFPWTP